MRKRRTKRWAWFPMLGSPTVGESDDDLSGRVFAIQVTSDGTTQAIAFPLVPDVSQEVDNISPNEPGQLIKSLASDYEIERIVGKVFIGADGRADDVPAQINPKILYVGVGLFVAQQADNNQGGPNVPIGSNTLGELLENYNPISNDTSRKPWMWRRTWVLTTGRPQPNFGSDSVAFTAIKEQVAGTGLAVVSPPRTNMEYGSVMDGPHIDSKVNRRVRSDQRLWCIAACRSLDRVLEVGDPTVNGLADIKGLIDVRVLGATRKARNNSAFSSG